MGQNMAYCRFRNTVVALTECIGALAEISDAHELSDEERKAALVLYELCGYYMTDHNNLDGV